jgi:hypothetical protein
VDQKVFLIYFLILLFLVLNNEEEEVNYSNLLILGKVIHSSGYAFALLFLGWCTLSCTKDSLFVYTITELSVSNILFKFEQDSKNSSSLQFKFSLIQVPPSLLLATIKPFFSNLCCVCFVFVYFPPLININSSFFVISLSL